MVFESACGIVDHFPAFRHQPRAIDDRAAARRLCLERRDAGVLLGDAGERPVDPGREFAKRLSQLRIFGGEFRERTGGELVGIVGHVGVHLARRTFRTERAGRVVQLLDHLQVCRGIARADFGETDLSTTLGIMFQRCSLGRVE